MCGRFTQRSNLHTLATQFQFAFQDDLAIAPRYNIAPTQAVEIVRASPAGSGRQLALVRWGLIPSWAKDPKIGNQTINARAETVAEKPAFRAAFKRKRCLVLTDGFYEWKKDGKIKQPYLIHRTDDKPFAFAGLWESWRGAGTDPLGPPVETCTILTTTANDLMSPLHDRMPVILHSPDFETWLDPAITGGERLTSLLLPYEGDEFTATPVSMLVNNTRNESPECVVPV